MDEGHINIPAPEAPSFIALDKKTGKLLWKSNCPGQEHHARPVVEPGLRRDQRRAAGHLPRRRRLALRLRAGDRQADLEVRLQPEGREYELGGTGTTSDFIGTPVVHDNKVYIGVGQDPEHTTGIGHFWCIDPTKDRRATSRRPRHRRTKDADGKPIGEKPNPNSCEVWHYGGDGGPQVGRRATSSSAAPCPPPASWTTSSTSPSCTGFLHCLDAKTGKHYWQYDTKASIWGSPYYVDGKVFLGNDDGDLFIFRHDKKHEVIDEIAAAKDATTMKEARKRSKTGQDEVEKKYLLVEDRVRRPDPQHAGRRQRRAVRDDREDAVRHQGAASRPLSGATSAATPQPLDGVFATRPHC